MASDRRRGGRGSRWAAGVLTAALFVVAGAVGPENDAGANEHARAELPAPLTDADFRAYPEARVVLGRALFYDKILSGGRNISCGSCHDHGLASGDALSLSLGEGAVGLGPERLPRHAGDAVEHRTPRNAPALFNLGATEFTALFWDGRLEIDPTARSGFHAPQRFRLPEGLDSLTAAQALFPIVSEIEMAGAPAENDVALASFRDPALGWALLEERIRAVPDYWPLFAAAYPEIARPEEVTIVHVANALGAFIETEWRADGSPFDRWLRGDARALSPDARAGAELFYGSAGCSSCHAGPLQTDHDFHAIAMPQIGPGRMPLMQGVFSDFGRMEATGDLADAYRFRTPSLRNVAETAPYGHSGAYATLEAVIAHHVDPEAAFLAYDADQAVLPSDPALDARDGRAMADARERDAILAANELAPSALGADEVAKLVAFLEALTDEGSLDGRLGKPETVPSGLSPD